MCAEQPCQIYWLRSLKERLEPWKSSKLRSQRAAADAVTVGNCPVGTFRVLRDFEKEKENIPTASYFAEVAWVQVYQSKREDQEADAEVGVMHFVLAAQVAYRTVRYHYAWPFVLDPSPRVSSTLDPAPVMPCPLLAFYPGMFERQVRRIQSSGSVLE